MRAYCMIAVVLAAGCGDICPGKLKCNDNTCCPLGLPYACGGKCYQTPAPCSGYPTYKTCVSEHADGGPPAGGGLQAQCQAAGLLYCQSPEIPGGEACCPITVGNPSAAVGYLCAWGSNVMARGCVDSLTVASDPMQGCILYGNGPPAAIVRCVR